MSGEFNSHSVVIVKVVSVGLFGKVVGVSGVLFKIDQCFSFGGSVYNVS